MDDPIVEEVGRARDAHAARFNYDLDLIFKDIKGQEKNNGYTFAYGASPKAVTKKAMPTPVAARSATNDSNSLDPGSATER